MVTKSRLHAGRSRFRELWPLALPIGLACQLGLLLPAWLDDLRLSHAPLARVTAQQVDCSSFSSATACTLTAQYETQAGVRERVVHRVGLFSRIDPDRRLTVRYDPRVPRHARVTWGGAPALFERGVIGAIGAAGMALSLWAVAAVAGRRPGASAAPAPRTRV